jgi:predicted metalloendopeptidase
MTKTKKNIKKSNIQRDFYGYINNDWIQSHQNKKKTYITNFEILNDKIGNNLKYLITNKLIKNKNINNLFNSYIHNNDEVINLTRRHYNED